MSKKAQGLSVNTIIVAALALLVLVVIALIFTGKIQLFTSSSDECTNNGGICVTDEIDLETGQLKYCSGSYDKVESGFDCSEDFVCCRKLKG
ncbi:MAG: hypothetical protein KKF44_00215 [Nanoarchaeota archaeon]|nr:hypothetical protein [Nanoarchaeota archaeon]